MRSRIKILLVDDHPFVRKGISSCLARHDQLLIAGEAADGVEAVAKARELLPDIMLLDLGLPRMSGLAVAEVLRQELPKIKVIIFSMYQRAEYLPRILQSGARGYVLKSLSLEDLVRAIETVAAGDCYFSPEIARLALTELVRGKSTGPAPAKLSNREREVLILLANGLSNKEVADNLSLGVRTVETYRQRLMSKLAIRSVAGLTQFALARRLIALPDELAPWDQDLLSPERVDRIQPAVFTATSTFPIGPWARQSNAWGS
jgi:two-component system, NarL family, nitrate/nitrite response regulator NarL